MAPTLYARYGRYAPYALAAVALLALGVALVARVAPASAARLRGPLDPGVRVADRGTGRSKCLDCEAEGVPTNKCLTCAQPSFRYLTETIAADRGADWACRGCRGAP